MSKDTQNDVNKSKKKSNNHSKLPKHLEHINKMAAGIDIGSKSHFVAIPEGCDEVSVREFHSFTTELQTLAAWLKKCKITTVAMESMRIIRAIVSGQRDPKQLALNRDRRCKSSLEVIEKSLVGNYRDEHLFSLLQALELYDIYQEKILACNEKIQSQLNVFQPQKDSKELNEGKSNPKRREKISKNAPKFELKTHLFQITGIDLTAIPGLDSYSVLKIISEVGLDVECWKSSKQFASWLGLCPGNKVSGGKRLSGKTKRTANYVTTAFRMAASTLHHSHSALGAFYRRLKSRLGAPKVITATAHKLATIFYSMLKNKSD